MSMPLNEEPGKVIERLLGANCCDDLELYQTPQRLRDFYVKQMRSLKSFTRCQRPSRDAFRPLSSQEELEDRGGINDDQRL